MPQDDGHPDPIQIARGREDEELVSTTEKRLEALLDHFLSDSGHLPLSTVLDRKLPMIRHDLDHESGDRFSLSILCHADNDPSLTDFIFNLIRFHLIPDKNLYPSHFQQLKFNLTSGYSRPLFLAEFSFILDNERELSLIESNLPFVIQVLERGIKNPSYAHSILNKQLSVPEQGEDYLHSLLLKVAKRGSKLMCASSMVVHPSTRMRRKILMK